MTTDILRPETLSAIWVLCLLAVADLVTGVSHAVRGGTFEWGFVADWVEKHLGGRVLPIAVVLVLAQWAEPLYAIAATASATYVAETIASIRSNLEVPSAE
jgi:hypothetical protein